MTGHNPITIFMTHAGHSIFRYYILALAVQGPTRLSPLDRRPGYSSLMISLLIVLADSFFLMTHYYSLIFISIHTLPFILSLLVYVSPFRNIGIVLQEMHQGHFPYIYL